MDCSSSPGDEAEGPIDYNILGVYEVERSFCFSITQHVEWNEMKDVKYLMKYNYIFLGPAANG